VLTAGERVTVHGTIFLVEVSPRGTTVAVDRGLVRVASRASGRSVDVSAGQRLGPGAAGPTAVEPDDLAALRWVAGVPKGGTLPESLDVFADPPNAEVAVDGVARGRTPLSLAVLPGLHRVRVTAPGRLPVEEQVGVSAGTPTLFRADLDPLASAIEAARPAPARADGDVLGAARAEMMAGQYARAIARLEPLCRRISGTPAARAALLLSQAHRLSLHPERAVPLLSQVARGEGPEAEQAQLLLAQTLGRDLSDPRGAAGVWAEARRRFPQGIFREEVAFRLGESLLSAGDTREGVEALERFLSASPHGAHADDAHLLVAAARRDRLSDCSGALPHLKAVAGQGPLASPRAELALIGAARCLTQLARLDEARAAYSRYLADRPRGRFAGEARGPASASARRR
jgi:tetratricopeptide (TPR) repeat protein